MSYSNYRDYLKYRNCCVKDGATGPAGPAGPAGPTGPGILNYNFSFDRQTQEPYIIEGVDPSLAIATGQSNNYTSSFSVRNNHLYLTINDIDLSGTTTEASINIYGTSVSESSAVPNINDTETIIVYGSYGVSYQSLKKWYDISLIELGTDISDIVYDIAIVGYNDFLNTNVKITGYRAEFLAGNTTETDVSFSIIKIKQNGSTTSRVMLEDISIDGLSNTITDGIRAYPDSRNYSSTVSIWPTHSMFVLKQTDFDDYYSSEENYIYGVSNEGFILKIDGTNIGTNQRLQFVNISLYYEVI